MADLSWDEDRQYPTLTRFEASDGMTSPPPFSSTSERRKSTLVNLHTEAAARRASRNAILAGKRYFHRIFGQP